MITKMGGCAGALKWTLLIAPHVLTLLLAIGYLLLGAYLFCTIEGWAPKQNSSSLDDFNEAKSKLDLLLFGGVEDDSVRGIYKTELDSFIKTYYDKKKVASGWTLLDGFLYGYSSVTTIGYSHLSTRTDLGRVFYVFYNIVGIPLCTLVLADWGLLLEEGLGYLCRLILATLGSRFAVLRTWSAKKPLLAPAESLLLLPIVLILYLLYVALGGVLLPFWERGWSFVEAFYVAFDGTTTIGIGDIYPRNDDYFAATLVYMSVGIAIAVTAIGALGDYLRVLHFAGKKPSDCALGVVWFGGKHMRVEKLVHVMGKEFGATEYEIRAVQDRLDIVINRAFDKRNLENLEETARRRNKRSRPSQNRDRWHDSVITPLTLVPVQNAATARAGGSFYAPDRQSDGS